MDRLIADDRQRRRHRAWTLAGTGVAVAVLALTPALVAGPGDRLPSGRGGSPSAAPSFCSEPLPPSGRPQPPVPTYDTVRAQPTERPEDGVARLTGVLRAALDDHLPAGLTVEEELRDCDQIQFVHRRSTSHYWTRILVTSGPLVEWLDVTLVTRSTDERPGCGAAMDHGICEDRRLPDGSLIAASTEPNPSHRGVERRAVLVQRVDGTSVTVAANNFPMIMKDPDGPRSLEPAPPPVVTMAQLTAIATTPGLTLYP
ncbi:hypothetical protein [Micromonospora sp. NPDC002717]|uniref:hypothetical protein n=1 Tax=Micromonospora sp. NPDC002717 TaxID=3154424 RepID=UPI00331798B1